jgi:hypothetical protein
MLRFSLVLLITIHIIISILDVIAAGIILVVTPWWISLPLGTIAVNVYFQAIETKCPLTVLENKIRRKMGLPEVDDFLKQYFYRPVCWCIRKLK